MSSPSLIEMDEYLLNLDNGSTPDVEISSVDDNGTVNAHEKPVQIGLLPVDEVVLIVLYSLTTALSVIGNLAAIIVFTVGRRSRTDLRWFLANLAAADLTMAVFCMPFTFTTTMLDSWIFSAPMCPLVMFFQTVSVTVSVCTSVAVGLDRYWVVNYPLRSRITKSRSPVVIGIIWVTACALSAVQLVIGRSNPYVHPSGVQVTDALVDLFQRNVTQLMVVNKDHAYK